MTWSLKIIKTQLKNITFLQSAWLLSRLFRIYMYICIFRYMYIYIFKIFVRKVWWGLVRSSEVWVCCGGKREVNWMWGRIVRIVGGQTKTDQRTASLSNYNKLSQPIFRSYLTLSSFSSSSIWVMTEGLWSSSSSSRLHNTGSPGDPH